MTISRLLTATLLPATLALATGCEKEPKPTNPPPSNDSGAAPASDDGGVAAADDGAAGEGGEDTEPGAPGVAWHDKTFDQKKTWMGVEVFPKMKAAFQGHDAATYKKFTCDTCHGEDGKEKGYEMPTDSIYPLNPNDPIKGAMEYDEEITKFMMDVVTPQMIEMLEGEQPYSADNPNGFGCMSCHPAE